MRFYQQRRWSRKTAVVAVQSHGPRELTADKANSFNALHCGDYLNHHVQITFFWLSFTLQFYLLTSHDHGQFYNSSKSIILRISHIVADLIYK